MAPLIVSLAIIVALAVFGVTTELEYWPRLRRFLLRSLLALVSRMRRFSLRSLLMLVTVAAVAAGAIGYVRRSYEVNRAFALRSLGPPLEDVIAELNNRAKRESDGRFPPVTPSEVVDALDREEAALAALLSTGQLDKEEGAEARIRLRGISQMLRFGRAYSSWLEFRGTPTTWETAEVELAVNISRIVPPQHWRVTIRPVPARNNPP